MADGEWDSEAEADAILEGIPNPFYQNEDGSVRWPGDFNADTLRQLLDGVAVVRARISEMKGDALLIASKAATAIVTRAANGGTDAITYESVCDTIRNEIELYLVAAGLSVD